MLSLILVTYNLTPEFFDRIISNDSIRTLRDHSGLSKLSSSSKMPPARRKAAHTSRNAQPTLSFNSKPTRVTKPSVADSSVKKLQKIEPGLVEVITEDAPTSEVALRQQIKAEAAKPKDEITLEAEKVTNAQIKKYWKQEEDVRKAPRGMAVRSFQSLIYLLTGYGYSASARPEHS